tara:strand:+ start:373 stop:558 length:186 start_codon:yes stop_codon:yes gene_type:complete
MGLPVSFDALFLAAIVSSVKKVNSHPFYSGYLYRAKNIFFEKIPRTPFKVISSVTYLVLNM